MYNNLLLETPDLPGWRDAATPETLTGFARIKLEESTDSLTLDGGGWHVVWPKTCTGIELTGPVSTRIVGKHAPLAVRRDGGETVELAWRDAGKVEYSSEQFGAVAGWRTRLSEFSAGGITYDFTLTLFVGIDYQSGDVILEARPIESGRDAIFTLSWPGGFSDSDASVLPMGQGMRLPKNWPHPAENWPHFEVGGLNRIYFRNCCMPWFGIEKDGGAVLMIIETPDDAGTRLHHPAGGPTELECGFIHTMGKLGYARRALVRGFTHGNYATLAKSYRAYLRERGRFVTVAEKAARSPRFTEMIGTVVDNEILLIHIQPASRYYQPDKPENNHVCHTTSEIAARLERLKAFGLERVYCHLDAVGFRGYDNLEPDSVPINAECGGAAGVKALCDTCHALGFLFVLHQQYRDCYFDSASFDCRHLRQSEDGSREESSCWYGGRQGFLCPTFAPWYLRRNNRYFAANGIELDGSYLDVFSVVPFDECCDPDHPLSRSGCRACWTECFETIVATQGIASSEEAADWAIPMLGTCHHAPYELIYEDNPDHLPQGMPIPLLALVYHDSLIVPWRAAFAADNETPAGMTPLLNGLEAGSIPYLDCGGDDETLRAAKIMADFHRATGASEMTSHEILDAEGKIRRSTFANGVSVTVNYATGEYEFGGIA